MGVRKKIELKLFLVCPSVLGKKKKAYSAKAKPSPARPLLDLFSRKLKAAEIISISLSLSVAREFRARFFLCFNACLSLMCVGFSHGQECNRYLTHRVHRSDVIAAWSGIRPLVKDPQRMHEEGTKASEVAAAAAAAAAAAVSLF